MFTRLADCLSTTDAMAEVFSDASILQAMLDFEAALARVEARAGIIPPAAADAIGSAAQATGFDTAELALRGFRAGTPVIPLVAMLTERVRQADPAGADFVHWGATSQDVADTALVLLLKRARSILAADHARLERALRRLSEGHAHSVMLGRTLLQAAPPVTFGLKAAGWYAASRRGWKRVDGRIGQALMLQFGGASGTLAALGDRGPELSAALAAELGIADPGAPWHAHRDRLAAMAAACGVYTGSLGKIARDISLLMQNEVGEVAEPGGGSSTMPHKRNPVACSLALAAATRVPGLLANFLAGMIQEHERAVGGWQAEWSTLSAILQSTAVALASMAEAAEDLTVDPERMRANIEATRGAVFAEKAVFLLAGNMGRDSAYKLVEQAVRSGRNLSDILRLEGLESPTHYLGAAEVFRARLLHEEE